MESLTSGTMAGTGSFRCSDCGYMLTLAGSDYLSDCPRCGGREFERTSLFSASRPAHGRVSEPAMPTIGAGDADSGVSGELPEDDTVRHGAVADGGVLSREEPIDSDAWLTRARGRLLEREEPGEYLAYEEGSELRTVPLTREWTRIGRSLAADVRFDDPTVSRRHALIVRQADGVRVLDDRSLNGVFVNGARVEWKALHDGDEIVVGRYRLRFLSLAPERAAAAEPATTAKPSAAARAAAEEEAVKEAAGA
jgi:predicted  nucleic acid-binding Zn-ribbon protein